MTKQKTGSLPAGLLALALGGFGIGLTEFDIVGLLPEIAADFAVTESVAGYLVSGYALAVAFGAIALTVAFSRAERKRVLLGLVILFITGNLISALAPTYVAMLIGRIIAALCHGGFFGVGAVVAASMVDEVNNSEPQTTTIITPRENTIPPTNLVNPHEAPTFPVCVVV